ncbi:VOC family protein [Psychrobacillus sp. FSL H8-0484]|uniref:VOC family protein n=1 Tax=Psychrobacillus sp. FSL H8-0484 TaxID=2921390 RepID=UPI0030F8B93E
MSEVFSATKKGAFVIHQDTHVGHVVLKVKDLERQIAFYEDVVGLQVIQRDEINASLAGKGGTRAILKLEKTANELQGARSTGVFHTAFLLPTREAFATKLFHILRSKKTVDSPLEQEPRFTHFERFIPIARLDSASDHGYSEAFYLYDIEGNGIEIYADRPREDWTKYPGGSNPLNFKELAELADFDTDGSIPATTTIGHVHLRVANVLASTKFYVDVIGFEEQIVLDSAFFISVGGYHHHIAGNVWAGENNPHPPANATGLKEYTLVLPTSEALEEVKNQLLQNNVEMNEQEQSFSTIDPSGNGIVFEVLS